MDTRRAKFKQQLRERDDEINKLQRELRVRVYTILLEFLNILHFYAHRIKVLLEMRV